MDDWRKTALALRERLADATPGRWLAQCQLLSSVVTDENGLVIARLVGRNHEENARLMAELHNAAEGLLAKALLTGKKEDGEE